MFRPIFLALTLLMCPPVWAAPALDATGAAAVKTMLVTNLDRHISLARLNGFTITKTGDMTVEPKGTYYAVTYPQLSATIQDMEDVGRIDIGTPTMNIMPGDKPGQWKMTAAIPTPLRFTELSTGAEFARLEIGTQKFAAVIDENIDQPLMLDFNAGNITFTGQAEKESVSAKIDDVTSAIRYTESKPGLYSGPATFALKNFSLDVKETDGSHMNIAVGGIDATTTYENVDFKGLKEFNTQLAALGGTGFSSKEEDLSPQAMSALLSLLTNSLSLMDGAAAKATLTNLAVTGHDKKSNQPIDLKIGELSYGASGTNMRADKSGGHVGFAVRNVTPTAVPPELVKFVPKDTSLSFGWANLPLKAILEQLATAMKSGLSAKDPKAQEAAKMQAMTVMMTLPKLLGDAGTTFTLKDTGLIGPAYDMNANGTFTAAAQALYGGTGNLKIIFTGLDQLVTDLQALAQHPTYGASVTQALQGLAGMQMFGQQGTGTGGKPARLYDLSVDAAGATKLNGTDLSALMGPKPGTGGAAPGAK